jgi:hypothetical protein
MTLRYRENSTFTSQNPGRAALKNLLSCQSTQ